MNAGCVNILCCRLITFVRVCASNSRQYVPVCKRKFDWSCMLGMHPCVHAVCMRAFLPAWVYANVYVGLDKPIRRGPFCSVFLHVG